ncbi:MAG: hypothetical protein JNN15_13080 [Blastocatellia bacterium]|nr:hypothetical protein [Blastocatellia bacterium]
MAKRLTDRQRLSFVIEALTENEISDVLEFISKIESKKLFSTDHSSDDLIDSLAEAPENRRARQVLEWEMVRRRAESQHIFGSIF